MKPGCRSLGPLPQTCWKSSGSLRYRSPMPKLSSDCLSHAFILIPMRIAEPIFFSHSLNIVDAIIIIGIVESSVVASGNLSQSIFWPVHSSFWTYSYSDRPLPLICISLSVPLPNSRYSKWVLALRAACQAVPRVTIHFIETPPSYSRMGCRKLQVNSLRPAGMKATIQRFNEAHPLGRVGMSRCENEEQCAIARGKGIFSAVAILRMLFPSMIDANTWKFRLIVASITSDWYHKRL